MRVVVAKKSSQNARWTIFIQRPIKNLTKTGEIGIFDIYERKEENEQKTLIN